MPRHLRVFPFRDRTSNARVTMEVYTGWVGVNFFGGGGTVHREEAVAFVLRAPQLIQPYPEGSTLLDVTVTAAPSSTGNVDDEANVAAVDDARVRLEPQQFPGFQGTPLCLVPRATVAAHHATVHGITYEVTVLTEARQDLEDPKQIDFGERPR